MYLKYALRNLFRNRIRTLITLLMIGSGSMAMVIAAGFIEDTVTQVREFHIRDILGHLRIHKKGFLQNGLIHPYDYMMSDLGPLMKQISGLPHVVAVGPRLSYFGLIGNGELTLPFTMEAFDPALETHLQNTLQMVQGKVLQPNNSFDIMIGEGLARTLNLRSGDSAVLLGNTQHGAMNASDANVIGIFQTISKDFDNSGIRAPISLAQRLLRVDGAQTLIVFLDGTEQTVTVKVSLEKMFADQHLDYEVQPWYEMPDVTEITTMEDVYRSIYGIIKVVLYLFVILSIVNTMNMAVLERLGEIGTLMALGTRRSGILKLFLMEGLILGIAGGLIGCTLGWIGAVLLSRIGIRMPNPPGTNMPWIARFAVTPGILVSAFMMAFLTSLISSVLPAYKASRLEVAEALRHNI